jgi:hypothetical protein
VGYATLQFRTYEVTTYEDIQCHNPEHHNLIFTAVETLNLVEITKFLMTNFFSLGCFLMAWPELRVFYKCLWKDDRLCGLVVRVSGSIPGTTRFSEK